MKIKKVLSLLLAVVVVATLFCRFCYPYKEDRAATYSYTQNVAEPI